jgi:hypothetical protein
VRAADVRVRNVAGPEPGNTVGGSGFEFERTLKVRERSNDVATALADEIFDLEIDRRAVVVGRQGKSPR